MNTEEAFESIVCSRSKIGLSVCHCDFQDVMRAVLLDLVHCVVYCWSLINYSLLLAFIEIFLQDLHTA